jgi:hypothetical protein
MSKAILEFNLSDEDDLLEFKRATNSLEMALSLWEMLYNTKKKIEWELESSEKSDSHYELLDSVYKRFWEILEENNVKLDDLIR